MSELNWDHLRVFIHVARTGRLSGAAEHLKLNHATVARRISAFEAELGTRLFDRSPQGVTLTNEGTELLTYAERIEHEAHMMLARVGGQETMLSGEVRVAMPEALSHFLVAPNLDLFRDKNPDIVIEVIPESRKISLSRRDADLIITTTRPRRGRMFVNKLAAYSMQLYASQSYIDRRGTPKSVAELSDHEFVGYVDDQLDTDDYATLGEYIDNPRHTFRSTSLISLQSAVLAGAGMGLLHSFAAGQSPSLVPVLSEEVSIKRTYWTLIHADLRRVPRIRAVIRFLQECTRVPLEGRRSLFG